MWGIWNTCEKRFVFGISEETKETALAKFRAVAHDKCFYKWRYEPRVIPKDWVNPRNPLYEQMYGKSNKEKQKMANVFEQFDKNFDLKGLQEDIAKAGERDVDFEDVPDGKYEVKVTKCELTTTKQSNKPMLVIWYKILEGKFKGNLIFSNRVLIPQNPKNTGFVIKMAKDDLTALGTDLAIEFESFSQFADLALDVSEIAEKLEYVIEKSTNNKGFQTIKVLEVFETE